MADDVMLALRRDTTPDRTVVHCSGRLTSGTAEMFKAEVKPLIVRGQNLVLDLSDLTFMDSMGLGTIAGLWVSAKSRSCALVLVNLSPRIRDLFTVTHLLSLFEACGETNAQIP